MVSRAESKGKNKNLSRKLLALVQNIKKIESRSDFSLKHEPEGLPPAKVTSWSNGCEQCPVTHHCVNLWLWIPGYVGKCSSQGTFSVVTILCHSPPSLTAPWLTWKLEVFHPSVMPPRDPPTRTMVSHYWSKPQFCTNEEAQRELCR